MNRKKFTTIILITLLTILPIISVVMMYHITLCDTLSKMDSGCYGDANTVYKIEQPESMELITESVDALEQRVALYAEKKYANYKIKAIYFNEYYVNFPMESGRFFRKSDLILENYAAVIGKGMQDFVYTVDNTDYIMLEGQEYEVLGVIGYKEDTVIDNCVYINIFTSEGLVNSSLYTLDIWENDSEVNESFATLLEEKNIYAKELTTTQSYGMTIFPQIMYGRWFLGLLFCNLLCIGVISVQWISLHQQEIGIRRLTGGSVFSIAGYVTKRYFRYAMISMIISVGFCALKFSTYLPAIGVGYAIILPVLLIIINLGVIKAVRIPLSEAIML